MVTPPTSAAKGEGEDKDLFALTSTGQGKGEGKGEGEGDTVGEGEVEDGNDAPQDSDAEENEQPGAASELRDPKVRRGGVNTGKAAAGAGKRSAAMGAGAILAPSARAYMEATQLEILEGEAGAGADALTADKAHGAESTDAESGRLERLEAEYGDLMQPPEDSSDAEPWSEFDEDPECMSASHRPNAPRMRERYFGPDARTRFFQRLQFVSKQRNIINWDLSQSLDELVFDNEDDQQSDYPFAGEKGYELFSRVRSEMDTARTSDDLSTITPDTSARAYPWKAGIMGRDTGTHSAVLTKQSGKIVGSSVAGTQASGSTFQSAYASEFPEPGADLTIPLSPRTRFLAMSVNDNMNPRASLILRKRMGKEINIAHMAIGNKIAAILADCLGDMPFIESLNVNNNALTDEGVAQILQACKKIKGLKRLNISRNKMDDDGSDALAALVEAEDCQLESLIMQVSDVDDFEGEVFVRKLMQNKSITEIDMSDNLLGRAENLRTTMPEMVTCTEAFADMLSDKDCILKKLTLAWNTIRQQSAVCLSKSLRANRSLTHLDISFNAFGTEGGEALGDALMENVSLKYLNVASNGITASACFTISTGCIENQALHRLIMDNNPIGEAGANAIMIVPLQVGARCKVSLEKCNVAMSDPKCWFSHSNPMGFHHLDLSKPYERAVAFALCNLIANHSTYIFISSEYEAAKGGPKQDLGLKQATIKDDESFFDARQMSIIAGLHKMKDAAGNKERGLQLFHEADADGGGTIDAAELTDLLEGVGMDVTEDMIDDIMMVYDIEGAGSIQLPEFLAFLKAQHRESSARLDEMTEMRVMATSQQPDRKYTPPRTGILHLGVMDGFTRKEKFSVISTCDADYAKQVSTSDSALMLGFAMNNSKIRLGEAVTMFSTMYNDGGQRAHILAKLVVKMANPADAKKLVFKITKGDKMQINMLKVCLSMLILACR